MQRQISIVIPTLGNHRGLSRTLETLESQRCGVESFEVLVVVDVAEPDPEAVKAAVGNRRYAARVLAGERPGASSNRNVGWRAATSPLVLFTDNDVLAGPDLVSEHLDWHRDNPDPLIGVLGHVRWADEIRETPFMRWLDHGIQFDYPSIEGTEAGWGRFYSANASVKRDLLERVGGFDEVRLPYLYEDLDLAYRASKFGFRLIYNRAAEAEHLREMDLDFWRRKMPRLATAEQAFIRIHPEIPPYFFNLFSRAAAAEPARGRGRHLLKWVPRRTPLLGARVWASGDLFYRQALAEDFLNAWEAVGGYEAVSRSLPLHPAGSPPGGP